MLIGFFKKFKPDRSGGGVNTPRLSKYQQAMQAAKYLRGVRSFNAVKAASVYVQSQDANVVEFHERLARYSDQLRSGHNITQTMCFGEATAVSLDSFFTTGDGYYVTVESLEVLCDQMDVLSKGLDALKARESDTGAYTERLLSKTFTTFITLKEAVSQAKTQKH